MVKKDERPADARSLLVCVPAYKDLPVQTVHSLFTLRNQIPFQLDMVGVAEVAVARTMLADRAKLSGVDYVLWLDSDMAFVPQHFFALHEALERDPSMGLISALAVRRDGSNKFCVNWREGRKGWKSQEYAQERCLHLLEDKDNLIQPVDVTGLAFTLMRRDVLDKIKRPWFQPAWLKNTMARDEENKTDEYLFFGEDSAFIRRLQDRGYRPSVHFGVHVGHIGQMIYSPPVPKYALEEMENGKQSGSENSDQDATPDGSEDSSG